MDKLIAVLENSNGEASSFSETGMVKVYLKNESGWNVINNIIFNIVEIDEIEAIKIKIKSIVEALENCKIFVGSKITGYSYTLFEKKGINAWQMQGKAESFLDYILEKEEELREKSNAINSESEEVPTPILNGKSGFYKINLKDVLDKNSNLTSKKVLLPFLKNTEFDELEIICAHIPKWFQQEFDDCNLKSTTEESSAGEIKVIVSHKSCCH